MAHMRQLRCSPAATKDPTSRNKDWRSCTLQLRPGTARQTHKNKHKSQKHIYNILVLKWTHTQVTEVLLPCLPHHFWQAHRNILVWVDRVWSFPCGAVIKNLPAMQELQETWVPSLGWEDPQRRAWQPTPVFLLAKPHGQRRLVGYGPQGHKESDTTEATEREPCLDLVPGL